MHEVSAMLLIGVLDTSPVLATYTASPVVFVWPLLFVHAAHGSLGPAAEHVR